MITTIHRQWFNQRMCIADKIVSDFGQNAELDAEMLLCCAISSLAATMWSGKGIDSKRFVQILYEFSPSSAFIKRISIFALIWQLEAQSNQTTADKLIDHFFPSRFAYYSKSPHEYGYSGSGLYAGTLSPITNPDEIDIEEGEICRITPELLTKTIRNASYANIIYSDLRSGLVHEYELGGNLTSFGWHNNGNNLNYVNFMLMPDENEVKATAQEYNIALEDARDSLTKTRRRLYFPYTYIQDLASKTANSVFDFWDVADKFDHPKPTKWWVDG